jgi:hypothetical protein
LLNENGIPIKIDVRNRMNGIKGSRQIEMKSWHLMKLKSLKRKED